MLRDKLNRIYVDALVEVLAPEQYEKIAAELKFFANLLKEHPVLHRVLMSPQVSFEQKTKIVKVLAEKGKFYQETTALLTILVKNNRLNILESLLKRYQQEIYTRLKKATVDVVVAFEISEELKLQLNDFFVRLTDCEVDLSVRQDEALLSGLVANINGRVIDSSLKGQLRKLKKQLLK